MTPTDINRRLALAIGYAPDDLFVSSGVPVYVWRESPVSGVKSWLVFDYMDWDTIGPIMEKYRIVPHWLSTSKEWGVFKRGWTFHACLRNCAARAMIEAHERGLLT